jgi:CRP-like cAMP-binding protein
METLEFLAAHSFFSDFDKSQLEQINKHSKLVQFNAGAHIFKEGEEASKFYIILKGLVALEVRVPNRGPVVIERIKSNDVLGWSWLNPPNVWNFDARAEEEVTAIEIDGTYLRELIAKDHEFGYKILQRITLVMEDRLQATRHKLLRTYDIYTDVVTDRPGWQKLL